MTNIQRPINNDQYSMTHIQWPIFNDPYTTTTIQVPINNDQYLSTYKQWQIFNDQYSMTHKQWPIFNDPGTMANIQWPRVTSYRCLIFVKDLVIFTHSNTKDDSSNILKTMNPLLPLRPLSSDVKQPTRATN